MEGKEKYISLSHYRLDGNTVCGFNDTQFLCLDKDEENEEDDRSGNEEEQEFLRKSTSVSGMETFFPPQSPPIDTVYDNFLGNKPHFHRISLYETKLRFYLVGQLKGSSTYRVLKIDRDAEEDCLSIDIDPTLYNLFELSQLLTTINEGNKNAGGLSKVATGDGILGFIRFTRGYYLVMITDKVKRGSIGPHQVYSVGKTGFVYIPRKLGKIHKQASSQENRYKTLFFSMSFTDFYFSYTYDLTHTLQHNLTYSGKPFYNKRFAWNHFLMKPLLKSGPDREAWAHPLIHGYFAQNTLSQHGRLFRLSIIARRSRYFAGTRYLKRGVNSQGRVANDVETEQIAEDCNWGPLQSVDRFSSFVQIRGSIPLFWGQEPRTLTPKPPIFLQRCDPLYAATKLHFRDLFRRFGHPIVVLNLVKKKEKKPRESILRTELAAAIHEINDPLPERYKIRYISWDFSHAAKSEAGNVITQMTAIAEQSIADTGFFHSGKRLYGNKIKDHLFNRIVSMGYDWNGIGKVQRGVLRSNCIDSLDRTNAAQFVVGKVAMGYQLYALGIIGSPEIDFDDQIGEVVMYLYQNMGNNLAMQYGGSELAHTMKSYKSKETGSLANKPRDMFTSFRRYYSNSFMDNEKQDRINLFLGNYKPWQETTDLWELETDYYLHMKDPSYTDKMMLYEKWWESSVMKFEEKRKSTRCKNLLSEWGDQKLNVEMCMEAYNLYTLSSFDKILEREDIVMLEQFMSSSAETQAYYGRRKQQWLTITPSHNSRSESEERLESNWDPVQHAHPNFELANAQLELQRSLSGPKHNLLSYYSISLQVSQSSITTYENYVNFKSVSFPKSILEKRFSKAINSNLGRTRKIRDIRNTVNRSNAEKPPMIASQSMVTVLHSPKEIRRNLNHSLAGTPPPRRSFPDPKVAIEELPKGNRNSLRVSNLDLYSRNMQNSREAYQAVMNKLNNLTIVSSTNEEYKTKFAEYRSRSRVLSLNITSPSHISNQSLLAYTKACAQQC